MSAILEELSQLPHTDESERIHMGPNPDSIMYILPAWLNEVAQVRQSYDPIALENLARAMVKGDMPDSTSDSQLSKEELQHKLELSNPLIVGRFTSLEKAQTYLDNHAAHYQLDIPRAAQSLEVADDGNYYILIAGHRRKRAINLLRERFGIAEDELDIVANVYEDIEFDEALGKQLRENVYEAPPVHEEARSIERYYNHVNRQSGKRLSIRALAGELGMSETKVGDALAFASLPEDVQAFTPDVLPYSIVRRLKPLYDLYQKQGSLRKAAGYDNDGEDEETYARKHILIFANRLVRSRLDKDSSDKKADVLIRTHMNELLGTMSYQTDPLFAWEEASITHQLNRSDRMLGKAAISVIEYLKQRDRLSNDERQRLIEVLGGVVDQPIEEAGLFAI